MKAVLSKEQKIRMQYELFRELKQLPITWKEVSDKLGFAHSSTLSDWIKKEKIPLNRVSQVYLFLEQYNKRKDKKK